MTLKSIFVCSFVLTSLSLFAQNIVVKGKIVSDQGTACIQEAEITVLQSTVKTSSDNLGNFEITAPLNAVITISKDGFTPYQLKVEEKVSPIIIRLKRAYEVSTGYQELPPSNLTGSIVSVQNKEFNNGIISSPEQLIQGKAAGVRITIGSGEPGGDTFTYIRGVASLRGSEPLYIVDGFPLFNDDVYASSTDFGRGTSHPRDPLNFLNPLDIESIDILKDESSTAIYGSRGGNGVVFIKTKSGAGAKNQLQFNSQFSLSSQQKYYDLLNRDQFLTGIADLGGDPIASDYGGDTDWQREINRSPFSQKYDLAYSNMYTTGRYRVSFGYDNQQGVIKESGLERIMGTASWNQSLLNNRLQIAANLSLSKLHDEYSFITTSSGFQGDLLGATYTANPTWVNDPEVQLLSYSVNPLSLLKYHDDLSTTKRTLLNLSFNYDLGKYISASAKVGVNSTKSEREAAISPSLNMSNGVNGNGRASIKNLDRRSDILEATLKYDRMFEHAHLTGMVGYAFQSFSSDGDNIEGWGFANPSLKAVISDLAQSAKTIQNSIQNSIASGYIQYGYTDNTYFAAVSYPTLNIVDLSSNKPVIPVRSVKEDLFGTKDEMQSFFTKVTYDIQSKIFFTGSLRVDGSTLFGSNKRYGLFPALSASWRLSEETFVPDFFSDLKFRAGYGKSGNQNIPHGAHTASLQYSTTTIDQTGNISLPTLSSSGIDNPDLKWEEMTGINLGLDVGLFENRIHASLDGYRKTTNDFLFLLPISQPAPISNALVNSSGKIINTGIELALNFVPIKRNNFSIDGVFNVAFNKNIMKDFHGVIDVGSIFGQGVTASTVQRIQSNHPLYSYYLLEFDGYDTNGFSVYKGNGQKLIGKNPVPKVTLSLGGTFQYKNWDATILFSGLMGYSLYNNEANVHFTAGSLANGRNVTTEVLSSPESPINDPEVSTRFLEDADFLRLQNVMVGHNFYLEKKSFKVVRAFLSGQNLVTWTNYSGLDPDINTGSIGLDYSTYPKARIITLGLQATF